MDRRFRRRVVSGVLLVIMLCLGIGLYVILGSDTVIRFDSQAGEVMYGGRNGEGLRVSPRNPRNLEDIVPVKPGYVFQGWGATPVTTPANILRDTSGITSETILYAQWIEEHYVARLYVNGIHVENIEISGDEAIDGLATLTSDWIIHAGNHGVVNGYYTFMGWEFKDLVGNRVTLTLPARLGGGQIPVNPVWTLTHYVMDENGRWIVDHANNPAVEINSDNLFHPHIYDTTFHAILEMNQVDLRFGAPFHIPATSTFNGTWVNGIQQTNTITVPAPMPGSVPSGATNFMGWALDIPNVAVSDRLVTVNSDGAIESISRFGHDFDEYGAHNDRVRLQRLLDTVWSPHEAFEIDPLLFYLSRNESGTTNRIINFRAIFYGDDEADPLAGRERFRLRTVDADGDVFMRDITRLQPGMEDVTTYAYIRSDDSIVFTLPSRPGAVFSHFEFWQSPPLLQRHQITRAQLELGDVILERNDPANSFLFDQARGTIFVMVWESQSATLDFERAYTRRIVNGEITLVNIEDEIRLINKIDFEDNERFHQEPIELDFELEALEDLEIGQTIALPTVAMYAGAHLTFSHWETLDGINVGRAGELFEIGQLDQTLRAIWLDNRVSFAFDLNGGRNFTPDLSAMRVAVTEYAPIPTAEPDRFGYKFEGWRVGDDTYRHGVTGQDRIQAQARRTVLVAQWEPRPIDLTLEYTWVENGQREYGQINIDDIPFDSTIRLRTISENSGFRSVAQLIGWRFIDRFAASQSELTAGISSFDLANEPTPQFNIDFGPTDTIRINESFAVRVTGDTEDTTLINEGLTGFDLKTGIMFGVTLFNDTGLLDNDQNAFQMPNFFNWQSRLDIIDPTHPDGLRPVHTGYSLNRDDFLVRFVSNIQGSSQVNIDRREWFEQQMATHDFAGFVYMTNTEAQRRFGDGSGWAGDGTASSSYFNVENGSFAHQRLRTSGFIHEFNEQGNVFLPAPTADMRLYMLWIPHEVEITIIADTDVTEITSYYKDLREGTNLLDNVIAQHETIADPNTMFSHWRATFEYRFINANGDWETFHTVSNRILMPYRGTVPGRQAMNWLFEPGNASTINHQGYSRLSNGDWVLADPVPHPVSRITLMRYVQDYDSLILQAVDRQGFDQSGRVLYGVKTGEDTEYTKFTNISSRILPIELGVDDGLRLAAASQGRRVSHYVFYDLNNTQHRFNIGETIAVGDQFPTRGHVVGGVTDNAFINTADWHFMILYPVYENMDFRIVVSMVIENQDGTMVQPERFPLLNNLNQEMRFFTGQPVPLAQADIFNRIGQGAWGARFGWFMAENVANLGFMTGGTSAQGFRDGVVTPAFRLGQTYTLDQSMIDFASGPNLDTIELWVHWRPSPVIARYRSVAADREFTVNREVGTFNTSFNLANWQTLMTGPGATDIRRLGFEHTSWQVVHRDPENATIITNPNAPGDVPVFNTGATVGTGSAGVVPANRIQNDWFSPREGNNMVIDLEAVYLGLVIPNVELEIMDRGDPSDMLATQVRVDYLPRDSAFESHNRFGFAPGVWSARSEIVNNSANTPIQRSGWGHHLSQVRFGEAIPVDTRPEMFRHEENISSAWQISDRILAHWNFAHAPTPEAGRVAMNLEQTHLILTDTSIFNTDRTDTDPINGFNTLLPQFRVGASGNPLGGIRIGTVWEEGIFRLLNVERELGIERRATHVGGPAADNLVNIRQTSSSHLQNGEGDFLFELAESDEHALTHGVNFVIDDWDVAYIPGGITIDGLTYNVTYTQAPVDLYSTLIHNPGQNIDNRFIRFGYELIGFRGATNEGQAFRQVYVNGIPQYEIDGITPILELTPLVTENFLNNFGSSTPTLFTHEYVAFSRNHRPTPVRLTPIWRPLNVQFVFIDNTAGYDGNVLNWPSSMVINTQFESLVHLPLLRTSQDSRHFQTDYQMDYLATFPVATTQLVNWTNFTSHRVMPSRNLFDMYFNLNSNPDPAHVHQIFMRPVWDHATQLTFNFNLVHRNANGDLVNPIRMNDFARRLQLGLKPDIVQVSPGVYTYVAPPGQNSPTNFTLPTLHDRDDGSGNTIHGLAHQLGFSIPQMTGMVSRGWFFGPELSTTQRLGSEGARITFVDGLDDFILDADGNRFIHQSISDVNNIVELYLLFDYTRGGLRFNSNGGSPTPPDRPFHQDGITGVHHNQEILFTASEMGVTRRSYDLLGWRYLGHIMPGTTNLIVKNIPEYFVGTPVFSGENFISGDRRVFNNIERFTAFFPTFGDGQLIVLEAVWEARMVPVRFFHGPQNSSGIIGTPQRITGPGFDGFEVQWDTEWSSHLGASSDGYNPALPIPPANVRPGHTFQGWYFDREFTRPVRRNIDVVANLDRYDLFARFVSDNFLIRFDLNNANLNPSLTPESRPRTADSFHMNGGFILGSTVNDLLPILDASAVSAQDDRLFLGWSTNMSDRTFLLDPSVTRAVLLGTENRFDENITTNGAFIIDVATLALTAPEVDTSGMSGVVNNGSRTFEITLFAVWSDSEVFVNYYRNRTDAVADSLITQHGFMFLGSNRTHIGGNNSMTVGAPTEFNSIHNIFSTDVATWGMMVRSNEFVSTLEGHNFLGWLPSRRSAIEPSNPLGLFPTAHPLGNRMFFPGEFLPSISESFDMLAVWAPYTITSFNTVAGSVNFTDVTTGTSRRPIVMSGGTAVDLPTSVLTANTRILSIPSNAAPVPVANRVPANYFELLRQRGEALRTDAEIILLPRSIEVIPSQTLFANNATHIGLPTLDTPHAQGLMLEARAIVSPTLTWIYVHDGLVGVDLARVDEDGNKLPITDYNPTQTVYNFVVGTVSDDGLTITTSFQRYVTTQGQIQVEFVMDGTERTDEIKRIADFVGQTEKYRFEGGTAFGALYTRTHDFDATPITGTTRELIAMPSQLAISFWGTEGWEARNTITRVALHGVEVIRSYAFAHHNRAAFGVEFTDMLPSLKEVQRHAFFHTAITNIILPRNANFDPAFISGFNPEFVNIGFGPGGATNNSVSVDTRHGIEGIWHSDGNLIYAFAERVGFPHGPIIAMTGEFTANPYSLYPLVLRAGATTLNVNADISLGDDRGLFFEHFGVALPNRIANVSIQEGTVAELDWRLFENMTLQNGMRLLGGGTDRTNIFNASTGLANQSHNRFGIVVANPTVAQWYQNQTAMGLVDGNSRFIGIGDSADGLMINYNRGSFNADGTPIMVDGRPAHSTVVGDIHTVRNLNFGANHEFITTPAGFLREGFVFRHWRYDFNASQNEWARTLTAGERATRGIQTFTHNSVQYFFVTIDAGDTRRIGMTFDNSTIHISSEISVVAIWAHTGVQFFGRTATGTGPAESMNVPIQIWEEVTSGNWDWVTSALGMNDPRLGVNGTRVRLPALDAFTTIGGHRYSFTGWRRLTAAQTLPPIDGGWRWTDSTNRTTRISPDGAEEFIIGQGEMNAQNVIRFIALYDRASANVVYTVNGIGLSAARNTAVAFDSGGHLSIPSFAINPITGFMSPVTRILQRGFAYPLTAGSDPQNLLTGRIYIGENVEVIGSQAFTQTRATHLEFARNLYTNVQRDAMPNLIIGSKAFAYNYRLTTVQIPSNTVEIGNEAFLQNFGLTTVTMSTGTPRLARIGDSAFENSRNLRNFFIIPSTVSYIGDFAFHLTDIVEFQTENNMSTGLTSGNPNINAQAHGQNIWHGTGTGVSRFMYVAVRGHLMMRRGGSLVGLLGAHTNLSLFVYAPGLTEENLNMHSLHSAGNLQNGVSYSVNHIMNFAFAHHRHLRRIFIPDGVFAEHGIFAFAQKLEQVLISHQDPATFQANKIDENAFHNMPLARIRLVVPATPASATDATTLPANWNANLGANLGIWQGFSSWAGTGVEALMERVDGPL